MSEQDFSDIPGTYVLTPEHSRKGYALNMFCMSLNHAANREAFRANEEKYLDRFTLSPEQRKSVLERDWLGMLRLGGNIYYTFKLAAYDGLSMQAVGGKMSGVSEEEFRHIMVTGGKDPKGRPRNKPSFLENESG